MRDLDGRAYTGVELIDIVTAVLEQVQKMFPHITLKLIASTSRFFSPGQIARDLELAFNVKSQRPNMIVGWDADGQEDPSHTTLDFASQILVMPRLAKKYGVDIPLVLHDGESDWSNANAVDAALLGAKRVGHGFNIIDSALLPDLLKLQNTAVEVCPISNQILRYVNDLRLHPGRQLLQMGVPIVLSSDDPGIWGIHGLSYDFWEAIVAWRLGVRSIKALAKNSLSYSGLTL